MDKWKDIELEKMKVGGNQNAREFLESHSDFKLNWSLNEKYNSKAAAFLRDKVYYFILLFIIFLDFY